MRRTKIPSCRDRTRTRKSKSWFLLRMIGQGLIITIRITIMVRVGTARPRPYREEGLFCG